MIVIKVLHQVLLLSFDGPFSSVKILLLPTSYRLTKFCPLNLFSYSKYYFFRYLTHFGINSIIFLFVNTSNCQNINHHHQILNIPRSSIETIISSSYSTFQTPVDRHITILSSSPYTIFDLSSSTRIYVFSPIRPWYHSLLMLYDIVYNTLSLICNILPNNINQNTYTNIHHGSTLLVCFCCYLVLCNYLPMQCTFLFQGILLLLQPFFFTFLFYHLPSVGIYSFFVQASSEYTLSISVFQ